MFQPNATAETCRHVPVPDRGVLKNEYFNTPLRTMTPTFRRGQQYTASEVRHLPNKGFGYPANAGIHQNSMAHAELLKPFAFDRFIQVKKLPAPPDAGLDDNHKRT